MADTTPRRPTRAVALAYHEGLYAPKVVAKGNGAVAEEILRRAAAAGVHVHHSADLLNLLMRVDLDQHIPEALYLAVAEVLAWIRRLDRPASPIQPQGNPS